MVLVTLGWEALLWGAALSELMRLLFIYLTTLASLNVPSASWSMLFSRYGLGSSTKASRDPIWESQILTISGFCCRNPEWHRFFLSWESTEGLAIEHGLSPQKHTMRSFNTSLKSRLTTSWASHNEIPGSYSSCFCLSSTDTFER